MSVYFIPLLVIIALGVYFIIRTNQRRWSGNLLLEGEKILYEEEKVKFRSARAENFDRTMNNLFLRLTNKRAFLLFSNKQNIFAIIDFTTKKNNTAKENISKGTLFVHRSSLKVEGNSIQMNGENFMNVPLTYEIEVENGEKIKKILEL